MQSFIKFIFFIIVATSVYAKDFSIYLFQVGASLDYKEYDSKGNVLDSESSSVIDIYGLKIGASYKYKINSRFYAKVEYAYEYLNGDSDYVGSELGEDKPYGSLKATTKNTIQNSDLDLKGIYLFNKNINFKLLLGYTYHQWERELSSYQVETYKWDMIKFGLGSVFRFERLRNISFDITALYAQDFSSRMDISNPSAALNLGAVRYYEFDSYVIYTINSSFDIAFGYIIRKQEIDKSDIVKTDIGYILEPDSEDFQQYIKLGIIYNF
jgi:hypothetical protein